MGLGRAEGAAAHVKLAETPPRGWNSYNSFSWIVSEAEFLDNAKFVSQNLLKFGYEVLLGQPNLLPCCVALLLRPSIQMSPN